MKTKRKARRGRQPGQAAKQHEPGMTLHAHGMLAHDGNYKAGVVDLLANLQSLACTKTHLEGLPHDARCQLLRDWRDEEIEKLSPFLNPCSRLFSPLVDWLRILNRKAVSDVLHTLLDAIARKDGRFFKEVARRVGNGWNLTEPAEPLFHHLWGLELARRHCNGMIPCEDGWMAAPSTAGKIRDWIEEKTGVHHSLDTIRDGMKRLGMSSHPSGRPKKGGTPLRIKGRWNKTATPTISATSKAATIASRPQEDSQ